jgi:hypothetical protein
VKLPLDPYSLRARFFPSVLVLAPAIAALAAWIPLDSASWKTLASVGCLAALATLLSQLARDLGKRREPLLFRRWGGPPAVRLLRHRDTTLPEATRERYHAKLSTLVPGISLPSSRSERARPDAADTVYASCCDWLREATRDRERFRLLFEENVGYGFRRNLWAMKPAGVALAILGLFAATARIAVEVIRDQPPSVEAVVAVAVSAPLLAWWLVRISPSWVAVSGDAYARRLLAACESL